MFEWPHTLQDVVRYLDNNFHDYEAARLKIERFADVHDKIKLIDMCSRSFVEKSVLERLLNITVNDYSSFNVTLAENDKKRLLSVAVYDTITERYVGGAFLSDCTERNYNWSDALQPIAEIIDYVEKSFRDKVKEENQLLYVDMLFADPDLSAAIHLEIMQLLLTAVTDVAKGNNYLGIATLATNSVSAVSLTTFTALFNNNYKYSTI